jgi:D-3-phosphoglycerate dehydrogenase
MKVLITSASFLENNGKHLEALAQTNWEIVQDKGPMDETRLFSLLRNVDGVICGDDAFTRPVLEFAKSQGLRGISKYGVGLDKIDLDAAKELGILVKNVRGVNQTTVAEHTFALLLSYSKNLFFHFLNSKAGKWQRLTGIELKCKTLGIIGFGLIGKEVAGMAKAFQMKVIVYDPFLSEEADGEVIFVDHLEVLLGESDFISFHLPLTADSKGLLNRNLIENHLKKGAVIINTSRGEIIEEPPLVEALKNGKVSAYLTDVLAQEPMSETEILFKLPNVYITPHVGSRTIENVENQGLVALKNLQEIFGFQS